MAFFIVAGAFLFFILTEHWEKKELQQRRGISLRKILFVCIGARIKRGTAASVIHPTTTFLFHCATQHFATLANTAPSYSLHTYFGKERSKTKR